MIYEREVNSLGSLMKEIVRLDSDAGIRLTGTYNGSKCLVFISRSAVGYAAIVCSLRKGSGVAPGRRVHAADFLSARELQRFLKKVAGGRVAAFVY